MTMTMQPTGDPVPLGATSPTTAPWQPVATPGGDPVTPVSGSTAANVTNPAATDYINGLLAQYGLQGLSQWAWNQIAGGQSADQITLSMSQTPEFKARFPAMDALSQKGRAITPAQYINYENQAVTLMRSYGLPQSFYDQPDDLTNLISGEVSVNELNQRLSAYQQVAQNAPDETKQALRDFAGITDGEVMAYFIDPNRALPLLQAKAQGAVISGTAAQAGYGQLSQAEADRLTALGVTQAQAQAGFGQLAGQSQLFNPLDQGEQGIGRDAQQAAAFANDAQAQADIQAVQARRVGQFQGGGGFASGQSGFSGAGASR
jgi:hypothetical protein